MEVAIEKLKIELS